MDLRHLRYFVAVAERGNVSRAAGALRVSQPALSRQIHDLETELKVALFERVGRGLRLTGAGEDLIAHARRALDSAGAFRERARAIGSGEVGVLRVGATPQGLQRLFPPLLQRFRRLMPGVDVRLTEGDSAALIATLRRGDLHLAITSYEPEFGTSCLPSGVLQIFAVRDGGRRAHSRTIEVRQLEDQPVLLLQRGYGSRDLFDAACRVAHIRTNIFLESNASATLLALAKASCGVAVVPSTVLLPRTGFSIQVVVQDGKPLALATAVHWNPRHLLPPYAERFAHELAQHARRAFAALLIKTQR
jgi:LysR family nitrogen assimilation transcriptional regulator